METKAAYSQPLAVHPSCRPPDPIILYQLYSPHPLQFFEIVNYTPLSLFPSLPTKNLLHHQQTWPNQNAALSARNYWSRLLLMEQRKIIDRGLFFKPKWWYRLDFFINCHDKLNPMLRSNYLDRIPSWSIFQLIKPYIKSAGGIKLVEMKKKNQRHVGTKTRLYY